MIAMKRCLLTLSLILGFTSVVSSLDYNAARNLESGSGKGKGSKANYYDMDMSMSSGKGKGSKTSKSAKAAKADKSGKKAKKDGGKDRTVMQRDIFHFSLTFLLTLYRKTQHSHQRWWRRRTQCT